MASSTGSSAGRQLRRGPLGLVADLLLHALAVVLEVGLDAQRDVLVLVALGGQLGDLGRDLRGQLVLGLLGGSAVRVCGGAPVRGADLVGAVLLAAALAVVRERRHEA